MDPQIRVIAPPGGVRGFPRHRCKRVANNSGKTRVSIDFGRLTVARRGDRCGAAKRGSACTGTGTMGITCVGRI